MYIVLYIVLILIGLVSLLAGGLGLIGTFVPKDHVAAVSFEVSAPASRVWAIIDDVDSYPQWLPMATRIEMLPEHEGHRAFRQYQGHNSFVLEETLKEPGRRVVRTIADDHKMFGGDWDHVVEAVGERTSRVTITENGTIHAAIPRAMMRLFFGYDHTLKQYQQALTAHANKPGL